MNRRQATADIFQAIAHPTRRKILDLLVDGERPVLALAERFRVSVPAISQHLGVLRETALVGERRSGRQRIYHLTPEPLQEVFEWMRQYERFWTERMKALGDFIARQERRVSAREPEASDTTRRKTKR